MALLGPPGCLIGVGSYKAEGAVLGENAGGLQFVDPQSDNAFGRLVPSTKEWFR